MQLQYNTYILLSNTQWDRKLTPRSRFNFTKPDALFILKDKLIHVINLDVVLWMTEMVKSNKFQKLRNNLMTINN